MFTLLALSSLHLTFTPMFGYIGTIASIAGIVAAAASLSTLGYQAAQSAPQLPNAAASSRQVAGAQGSSLPTERALSAAEQQGTRFPATPAQLTYEQAVAAQKALKQQMSAVGKKDVSWAGLKLQLETLNQQMKKGFHVTTNRIGGVTHQTADGTITVYRDSAGNFLPAEIGNADFTGYGRADIEGQLAGQMADIQSDLSKKYGTQFAEEARHETELADPEGTAARKAEYDMIQQEINNPKPINPLSGMVDSQIGQQLKAGAGLDDMSKDVLDAAIARANANRGGNLGAGAVSDSMSTGAEGQARRQAAYSKAQNWLSSGSTPDDINYRREQQNLANLGSFIGGRTPQSQFQNLSGISAGNVPMGRTDQMPQQPNNAGTLGPNYVTTAYQQQVQAQGAQANPWLAGISGLLNAGAGLTRAGG